MKLNKVKEFAICSTLKKVISKPEYFSLSLITHLFLMPTLDKILCWQEKLIKPITISRKSVSKLLKYSPATFSNFAYFGTTYPRFLKPL